VNRHALTPVERQKAQLEKLLKDPEKPAYIPTPPKEKTIRAAREMMKNVQGSSAGAGSGEFHVYKASRRREYERLKLMEDSAQKEAALAEFEKRRNEAEASAEAKTSKNRAKRQKKKERAKAKGQSAESGANASREGGSAGNAIDTPLKKRRLVNGTEMVFRKPAEETDEEDSASDSKFDNEPPHTFSGDAPSAQSLPLAEEPKLTIIDED